MRQRTTAFLRLPASVLGAACLPLLHAPAALGQSASNTTATFIDATATHVPTAATLHALDAEFVDVDQDGDLDVVLAVEGDVNRLYLNDGKARLTWKEGVFGNVPHDTEHVLSGDFNQDGHADVMFIAEDDQVHQLFFGDGKGAFTDVS